MKTFTDGHALKYLQSPRSDKNREKRFSYGNTGPFLALLMACGRWGHVFVTSANPRSCKKKWPCRPLLNLLLVGENMMPKCVDCASGICEGGDFRQLVPTTTPKHEKYHTDAHEQQWKRVTWPLFFSGPMIGATISRENVSPPTTGPRKGKDD